MGILVDIALQDSFNAKFAGIKTWLKITQRN